MEGDTELLMEVLSVREEIENASEEERVGFERENEQRMRGCEAAFERCIGDGRWMEARGEAVRLRYWSNIGESLRE